MAKKEAKQTQIVLGFPGVGKSVLFHMHKTGVLDSDSSSYSWKSNGVRNPAFPKNYVKHIKSQIGKQDLIMVSTHETVRDALIEEGLEIKIVYPDKSLKEEYKERYIKRQNSQDFVDLMMKKWEQFIGEIESLEGTPGVTLVKLESNQFMADVVKVEA